MPTIVSVKRLIRSESQGVILDNQFRQNSNGSFIYDKTQPELFDDIQQSTTPEIVPTKVLSTSFV